MTLRDGRRRLAGGVGRCRVLLLTGVLAGVLFVPQVRGQNLRPSFDVASIKRNTSGSSGGGGGLSPGGRFRLVNVNVQTMILIAYRTGLQLFPSQLIGAPDWTSSEYYDITAKVAEDLVGKPQAELFRAQPLLLQSLLEDRFKLSVRRDTRQLPIYSLVLASKDGTLGPQLRRSILDCVVEPRKCSLESAPGRFTAGGVPISALVALLAPTLQRVVVDRTGLEGRFAVTLEWTPDRTPLPLSADATAPPSDKPSLVTALQEQLGLKLESTKGPVDVLVIDHVEKPTPD